MLITGVVGVYLTANQELSLVLWSMCFGAVRNTQALP